MTIRVTLVGAYLLAFGIAPPALATGDAVSDVTPHLQVYAFATGGRKVCRSGMSARLLHDHSPLAATNTDGVDKP